MIKRWLILQILSFGLSFGICQAGESWPGVDLSLLSQAKGKSQSLQGEWRLYPGQFIEEADLAQLSARPYVKFKMPGQNWPELAPQRFATAVLALEGLPDEPLTILFDQFFATHRSYFAFEDDAGWHQTLLLQTGKLGTDRAGTIMEGRRVMARLPEKIRSGFIIVHMANFYSTGRIVGAPIIGFFPEFERSELIVKRWEGFFVLGSFFLLLITNLALFIQRPEDKASLSMAAVSLTLGLRYFSTEGLWSELFQGPHQAVWTLQQLGMILGNLLPGYFMVSFLRQNFPSHFPRRIVLAFRLVTGFILLWIVWELPLFKGGPQKLSYFTFLFMIPYCLIQSMRAAKAGLRGAGLSAIGTFIMAACVVNDGLIALAHAYDFIFLSHYGMIAYIFTQSMMVGKNFSFAFRTADRLSRELKLEVERQTRDAKAILNHVHQGLMTLSSEGLVNDDYAAFVKDLLETQNPSGQNITSLFLRKTDLTQEQQDNVMSVLCTVVGEDPLAFDMNVDNLPKMVVFQGRKVLELDWQPVVDESTQTVAKMLLAIKDVTTLRELEERNKQVQGDMQIIARLLEVSAEKFQIFHRSAKDMIGS